MKLNWKGNQKYNEDISKATILKINDPVAMSIHKYLGCGDALFFTCMEFGLSCVDLHTENWEEAETIALKKLKDKCDKLVEKIDKLMKDFNGENE